MQRIELIPEVNHSQNKKKKVRAIFQECKILYSVLYTIIFDYLSEIWTKENFYWGLETTSINFIAFPDSFYVWRRESFGNIELQHYNRVGDLLDFQSFTQFGNVPISIDFDQMDKTIYILFSHELVVFNLNLELISNLTRGFSPRMFGFKMDDFDKEQLFITKSDSIERITKQTGEVSKEWKFPMEKNQICFRGLTVSDKFIYVCESKKHQIQVIPKKMGRYAYASWQNLPLFKPTQICLDHDDQLIYIGDAYNIHIITTHGNFVKSLYSKRGEIKRVHHFCILNNYLFILEQRHLDRLHVWKRQ